MVLRSRLEPSSAKPLEESKNEKVSGGREERGLQRGKLRVKSWISKLWTILRNQIEAVERLIRRMR
jgi:hypothetical protein